LHFPSPHFSNQPVSFVPVVFRTSSFLADFVFVHRVIGDQISWKVTKNILKFKLCTLLYIQFYPFE